MKLKTKLFLLVLIPVVTVLIFVISGWLSMSHQVKTMDEVINKSFKPIVEDDLETINSLYKSLSIILEADRDVHQALIAERKSITNQTTKEYKEAQKDNLDNIGQAENRMKKASIVFNEKANEFYQKFLVEFNSWKNKSTEVVALAHNPSTLNRAKEQSKSALAKFDSMRDCIDQITNILNEQVSKKLADIKTHKDKAVNEAVSAETSAKSMIYFFILTGIAILALAIISGILISKSISRPIQHAADMLKDISEGEGDLTRRLDVLANDEIGRMAKYFNNFVEKLEGIISQITANAESLAETSGEMTAVSTELASGAEEMNSQAENIASATEQMSANIHSVDEAANLMNKNAQNVSSSAAMIAENMNNVNSAVNESQSNIASMASASEEMTSTINEISQNTQKANETTLNAVESVNQASTQVEHLAEASQEINQIINVIVDIAEQTKLLALNATIEAARAGEAGKGFAVVANEVKDLAKQTNEATEDIKRRVIGMQDSTSSTVEGINRISEVIEEVNSIVGTIAAAVEEQNVTMKDNAKNVAQASEGIQEVAGNVAKANEGVGEISQNIADVAEGANTVAKNTSEASIGAADVAKNITGVSDASKDTTQGAQKLNTMATDLSDMANTLRIMMAKFKVSENANQSNSNPRLLS
jgi:methyl-accepting chemotaxis protein